MKSLRTFSGIPGIPEGYELVGIREPVDMDELVYTLPLRQQIIIAKVGKWKPAIAKNVLKMAPLPARFRDAKNEPWQYGTVVDYARRVFRWKEESGVWFRYCEVKDV